MRGWVVGVVAASALGLSGCPALLLGAGVAGGYAISQDSVRNQFDLPKSQIYQRALTVSKQLGFVTLEDEPHGRISLKIQSTKVSIEVNPLTRHAVELKVSGRNEFLMPDVQTAQAVYNKIIEGL